MNPHVAAVLSGRFSSEEDADCVIRYIKEEDGAGVNAGQLSGSGSKGPNTGATILGNPLPGHLILLRAASEMFRAQADRWQGKKPPKKKQKRGSAAATAAAGTRPEILIKLRSADEVPATNAAIAFVYTGRVEAGSVRELLEVRRQGDYLQIEGCPAACVEALKGMVVEGDGNSGAAAGGSSGGAAPGSPAVLQFFACEALWPDQVPAFTALVSRAKPLLVSHFRDTLYTQNTPSVRQQLLELSAAGVEALLESDDFGTDTESSVFLVLATWMEANHAKTDAATRQRLCGLVRLVQLSRPYLYGILPALAHDHDTGAALPAGWWPVSGPDAALIACLASAGAEERRSMEEDSFKSWDPTSPMFKATPRRQCLPPGGLTIPWSITEQLLRLGVGKGLQPDQMVDIFTEFEGGAAAKIAAGFDWRVFLRLVGGQAAAGVYLDCKMPSAYLTDSSQLAQEDVVQAMVPIHARVEVHRWRGGVQQRGVSKTWHGYRGASRLGYSAGYVDALPLRQTLTSGGNGSGDSVGAGDPLAAWADYLHGGKIAGTLTLLPPTGPP